MTWLVAQMHLAGGQAWGLRDRPAQAQALLLTYFVMGGRAQNLPEPQFPHSEEAVAVGLAGCYGETAPLASWPRR